MKIERISETQVKFLITDKDLKEREITLSEILTQSTPSARDFFKEIMKEAIVDFNINIDFENGPIIMEAMLVPDNSVMIIVSKAGDTDMFDERNNFVPKTLTERKYKQDDIKIIESEEVLEEEIFYIYSFDNLEQVSNVSIRFKHFSGKSILYKLNDKYYLAVEKIPSQDENLDIVFCEYARKHISTPISKYYLEERGEYIVKENAINILASI